MRYHHYFDTMGSEKYAMEKYASLNMPKVNLCETCEGYCQQACPFSVPAKALLTAAHQQLTLA